VTRPLWSIQKYLCILLVIRITNMVAITNEMVANYWNWDASLTEPFSPPSPHKDVQTGVWFLMNPANVNSLDFGTDLSLNGSVGTNESILFPIWASFFDEHDRNDLVNPNASKVQAAKETYNVGDFSVNNQPTTVSVDNNANYASISGVLCPPTHLPVLQGAVSEYSTKSDFPITIPPNTHQQHLDPHNIGMVVNHSGNFLAGSHGYWVLHQGFSSGTHTVVYVTRIRGVPCAHAEGSPHPNTTFVSSRITYTLMVH
jgi:hypothetical protein